MSYVTTGRAHERSSSRRYWLLVWALAVLFFVVGDAATTFYGVNYHPAVSEVHPVAQAVLGEVGFVGLLATKALVLAVALVVAVVCDRTDREMFDAPHIRYTPPMALAAFGLVVTCWNLVVLTGPPV